MEGESQRGERRRHTQAWAIALLFFVLSSLWILAGDFLLGRIFTDPDVLSRYQTYKGLLFVFGSSLLIFWLVRRQIARQLDRFDSLQVREETMQRLGQFRESVIDNADIWLNVLDAKANVVLWNKAAERISGYAREEVTGHGAIWEWLYPDLEYRARITAEAAAIISDHRVVENFETTIRRKDGGERIISWNSRNLTGPEGRVIGSIATGCDVTAQKKAEASLRVSERRMAGLLANLPGMAYRCRNDADWTMEFVSEGSFDLLGYLPCDLIDNRIVSYAGLIHAEDRARIAEEVERAVGCGSQFTLEYRVLTAVGGVRWVWEQGRASDAAGTHLEGIVIDITARKEMERELERLATHDGLTGLYNRRELDRQLTEEIERARRYERPLSIIVIDIDHFKQVNDAVGHQGGDAVLCRLAQLLQSGIRKVDYAARYGGEEIVIILPEMSVEEALEMAERLRCAIAGEPIVIDEGESVSVTASFGVAGFPVHGSDMRELIGAADAAVYRAKELGRDRVCVAGG